MAKLKIQSLPFDQYSRQLQVAKIIDTLRTQNESFSILDVGGYKGATKLVQPKDEVIVIDVFPVKEKGYIQGDGLHLPFDEGSFDFVVSFDVLEHISTNKRAAFITESARVAKRAVITAAPFASKANEYAEVVLNDLFKALHGKEHQWLKEHIDYGLPAAGLPQKVMGGLGLYTCVLPSNAIVLWILMQRAIFITSKFPAAAQPLENLNIAYNQHGPFDGNVELELNYRHITCGFVHGHDAEKIKRNLMVPSKGFLTATRQAELANNVAAFFTEVHQSLSEHAERLEKNNSDKDQLIEELTRANCSLTEKVDEFQHSMYGRAREKALKLRNKLH